MLTRTAVATHKAGKKLASGEKLLTVKMQSCQVTCATFTALAHAKRYCIMAIAAVLHDGKSGKTIRSPRLASSSAWSACSVDLVGSTPGVPIARRRARKGRFRAKRLVSREFEPRIASVVGRRPRRTPAAATGGC